MEGVDPVMWKEPAGRPMKRCTGPRPGVPQVPISGVCVGGGREGADSGAGRGWTTPPPARPGPTAPVAPSCSTLAGDSKGDPSTDFSGVTPTRDA